MFIVLSRMTHNEFIIVFRVQELHRIARSGGEGMELLVDGLRRDHHGPELRPAAGVADICDTVDSLYNLLQQSRPRLHTNKVD